MSKKSYFGVSGVARNVKSWPVGIGNVARKAKSGYFGVGGVARQFLSGVDPVLNNNDWATIRAVSDASQGANYWSVGDTKTITINGKVGNTTFSNLSVDAFILGFNHNRTLEGTKRIHFQIGKTTSGKDIAFCDSNYGSGGSSQGFRMNLSETNVGGWKNSYCRNTLLGNRASPTSPYANSFIAALPASLRAVMKSVKKYTNNTGNSSDTYDAVTSTTDYLFLLAEFEIHGGYRHLANGYEQNFQEQYDYYKAGNSKVKYRHDATNTAVYYWCRSAFFDDSSSFCCVYTNGKYNMYLADYSYGLAPGFCV